MLLFESSGARTTKAWSRGCEQACDKLLQGVATLLFRKLRRKDNQGLDWELRNGWVNTALNPPFTSSSPLKVGDESS